MRIVYLGTPEFSVLPLKSIVENTNHQVVGVVCNKDKPVGRKKIMTAPPVKLYAQEKGIKVFQYDKIRLEGVEDLKSLKPDMMITCAFGQILSQEILDIPVFGTFNIHASLLPAYRGASPIHYAILNGERQTGITIMKTDAGIDTGDIILQKSVVIDDNENCGQLFEKLSKLGSDCILDFLKGFENNQITYTKQDDNLASYTKIIKKEHAKIDWSDTAENIFNKIRAFNPSPVAYTMLDGMPFKIFSARVVKGQALAGQVVCSDGEFIIGTGKDCLSLLSVQKAGGKQMDAKSFLLGNKINKGSIIFNG